MLSDVNTSLVSGVLVACLLTTGVFFSPTAVGEEYCSKPVVPYCVNSDASFDTTLQVNSCRRDLDNYEEQLADYEQCVADGIETIREKVADARETLEEVEEDL